MTSERSDVIVEVLLPTALKNAENIAKMRGDLDAIAESVRVINHNSTEIEARLKGLEETAQYAAGRNATIFAMLSMLISAGTLIAVLYHIISP